MMRAILIVTGVCAVLCGSMQAVAAEPQETTFVYRGSADAVPTSLRFQIGDRLVIRARPSDLQAQLVGRSVRVDGRIRYYERTHTYERKTSSSGCGFLGCCSCYEEVHQEIFAEQDVWNVTSTQYTPFLQVGPMLRIVTVAGEKPLQLHGADTQAREILSSGGYTYVALHDGELFPGRLVLPANSFDLGPPVATPEERQAGNTFLQGKCAGKPRCSVMPEKTKFKVTQGTVELHLTVELHRPENTVSSP